jgi:hypothetical protein
MTWGSRFIEDPVEDRVHDDLHDDHATAVRERERCNPGRSPWQTFLDTLDRQADQLFQPVARVFENVFRLALLQSVLQVRRGANPSRRSRHPSLVVHPHHLGWCLRRN